MPEPGIRQQSRNKLLLEIATHIVVWLAIFCLPYMMRFNFSGGINRDPGMQPGNFFYLDALSKLLWVIVFYLNAFLLAPLFIYRRKYVTYALIVVVMLMLIALLHHAVMNTLDSGHGFAPRDTGSSNTFRQGRPPGGERRHALAGSVIFSLAPYFLTVVAGILYRVLKDRARAESILQQKIAENMKTELSFLRSQISPHFIFNILNNITALARLKSDELEPTIIRLSSLMRYMLYQTQEERVLLRTETEYLQSYIDLQQQRFGSKVNISVMLDDSNAGDVMIEPMLLIPFVENAFKHGTGRILRPEIIVSLTARDGVLHFTVVNTCSENEDEIQDPASGIGFSNVRRRLSLLYGKSHELRIHKETDRANNIRYHVALTIKLHDD